MEPEPILEEERCVDKSARSNIRVKLWYNERVGEGAVYIPHRAAG